MTTEHKKSSIKRIGSVIFFVLAFIAGKYAYQYISGNDKTDLNSTLMAAANELNINLPMMVDGETRLDSSIGINRTFRYNYTLINYAAEDVDADQFKVNMESTLINSFCTTKEMEVFTKNDVPVTYAYHGKNGKQITTITVNSSQCGS